MHGVVDYAFAAGAFALPRLLEWDETAKRASDMAGAATFASSLLTDYRLSLARVIPMKGHLALDVLTVMSLVGAAARANSRGGRSGLLGMATFGSVVAALTRTD